MSSSPYIVEIKNLEDLPTCIICHQNIQDNAALDKLGWHPKDRLRSYIENL